MKSKTLNIWKEMSSRSRWRLSFAVFLMFSALGPITLLMESKLHSIPWETLVFQTFSSGGLAASIILTVNRKWLIFLVVLFWGAIMFIGSGGLSISIKGDKVQTVIGKIDDNAVTPSEQQLEKLTPQQLDAIFTQRTQVGLIAIALIAFGYTSFIVVFKNEIRERARLQTEMAITQNIQQSLQPAESLRTSWCTSAGCTVSATEVGGDYYDFVKLSEDKVAIIIADVSGHGVGAGILSAMTKSAFHSELLHNPEPSLLLQSLNSTLYEVSNEKMFVTVAYMVLDSAKGTATIATAGHPPVLHKTFPEGRIAQIRMANIALGMKKEMNFASQEIPLKKGDSFLLYTDGVVEATDSRKEQFGVERLVQSFGKLEMKPEQVCSTLIAELNAFSGEKSFKDDVTLVSIFLTS